MYIRHPVSPDTPSAKDLAARLENEEKGHVPAEVWKRLFLLTVRRLADRKKIERPEALAQLCAAEAFHLAFTWCDSADHQKAYWEEMLTRAEGRKIGPGTLKKKHDPLMLRTRVAQVYAALEAMPRIQASPRGVRRVDPDPFPVFKNLCSKWRVTFQTDLQEWSNNVKDQVRKRRYAEVALSFVCEAYGFADSESLGKILNQAGFSLKGEALRQFTFPPPVSRSK
jgi:hypothetical protein